MTLLEWAIAVAALGVAAWLVASLVARRAESTAPRRG